VYLLKLRSA